MSASKILVIALAYLEAHGRELAPQELKDASNFYRVPWRGPASPDLMQVLRTWPWISGTARSAIPQRYTAEATGGERYRCRDWGCPCGWVYEYAPGEPMAVPS